MRELLGLGTIQRSQVTEKNPPNRVQTWENCTFSSVTVRASVSLDQHGKSKVAKLWQIAKWPAINSAVMVKGTSIYRVMLSARQSSTIITNRSRGASLEVWWLSDAKYKLFKKCHRLSDWLDFHNWGTVWMGVCVCVCVCVCVGVEWNSGHRVTWPSRKHSGIDVTRRMFIWDALRADSQAELEELCAWVESRTASSIVVKAREGTQTRDSWSRSGIQNVP